MLENTALQAVRSLQHYSIKLSTEHRRNDNFPGQLGHPVGHPTYPGTDRSPVPGILMPIFSDLVYRGL